MQTIVNIEASEFRLTVEADDASYIVKIWDETNQAAPSNCVECKTLQRWRDVRKMIDDFLDAETPIE